MSVKAQEVITKRLLTLELLFSAGVAVEDEEVVLLEMDCSAILEIAVADWLVDDDKGEERAEGRRYIIEGFTAAAASS
jgi:hypothetical protein